MARNSKATTDPVFALIRAHEQAAAAADRAAAAFERRKAKIKAAEERKDPYHSQMPSLTDAFPRFLYRNAYFFADHDDVKKHVGRYLPDDAGRYGPKTKAAILRHRKAAERELCALFDRYVADWNRQRRATGLTVLNDAFVKTRRAANEALRRLYTTKPMTRAGLLALLDHVKKYEGTMGNYELDPIWSTLAGAVRRLAA